ncbi:MAG TPA: hypothetical protein VKZ53_09975 [Candidatus Angelobacter sp.]|nr:hypothetical protein [Candidatus Angelobacter sp.]
MNPHQEDKDFEVFLRRFRPKTPRALPEELRASPRMPISRQKQPRLARRIRIIAGIAALVLMGVTSLLLMRPRQTHLLDAQARVEPIPRATIGEFSRLIREDRSEAEVEARIGAAMDEISRSLLPNEKKSRGLLKALAAEAP